MDEKALTDFKRTVYDYYGAQARQFPWRHINDPYRILVSEIMLQQTQTHRVLPKYENFITLFPGWQALAAASVQDVLTAWQGLGYNRRALALKKTAELVVREYGGELPKEVLELVKLPGIGQATASAIRAFAFNLPGVFIETNIRRAFIHHFFADAEKVHDKELLPLIEKLADEHNPRDWYYALMDYGAMLGRELPNPNRRSRHYAKQPTFQGSNRQLRGKILHILLKQPILSEDEIITQAEDFPERVKTCLQQLTGEGFLKVANNKYHIAK